MKLFLIVRKRERDFYYYKLPDDWRMVMMMMRMNRMKGYFRRTQLTQTHTQTIKVGHLVGIQF